MKLAASNVNGCGQGHCRRSADYDSPVFGRAGCCQHCQLDQGLP